MCVIAFTEVDKGTIEASKSMGATNTQIIWKILLPESMPALVSGIAVTGISLVSYTAMAGAIGAGGLGNLAYLYGFARRNNAVLYSATAIIVLIVFAIQLAGDTIVRKIDKR
jgi:D-methionine transport system permease protein